MGIEVIAVIVLVVVGGAFWYFNKDEKDLDINDDGKVDVADIKEAASNVAKGVKAEVQKLPTPAKLKAQTKKPARRVGKTVWHRT